ncbi:MAG: hypothetical protein SGBAC_011009 [Bacillariaceae sp.]
MQHQSYVGAVGALCLCSLANAFVIVSIFPYAGYMVLGLLPDKTPEDVGGCAGILASSFMLGRCGTAYLWGEIADQKGRVFVLQFSLILSTIFSILFGMSTSFSMAIVWRLCLGLSSAVTSTAKTLASEIGHGDEEIEKQAMGLMVGMRSWGFLLGPAIGGLLSQPIQQYPKQFENNEFLSNLFGSYPYLLPNIVVAATCLAAATLISFAISETLENNGQRKDRHRCVEDSTDEYEGDPENDDTIPPNERTKLMALSKVLNPTRDEEEVTIWSRRPTRVHMIFNWIFSFVVTVIDDGLPLFTISSVGGLGYEEKDIGHILSLAGLIFALGQYATYHALIQRFGGYQTITLGCALGLVPVSFIPVSVWMMRDGFSKWSILFFLSMVIGLSKVMVCACFSSLAIATNRSVPKQQRAKMNGILLIGSSITKGIGPIFAGFLVSVSFSKTTLWIPPEQGSILIFGTIGIMGLLTTRLAVFLK